jgi:Predicted membrane protein
MKQLALYGLNGVVNTITGYVVFFALTQLIDYRLAIVVGYLVAMVVSYLLNSQFVFRSQGSVSRFVLVNLVLMASNVGITWCIVHVTGMAEELAQLIAIPIVFLVGFGVNKSYVFGNRDPLR